jgi:hypothetical protein
MKPALDDMLLESRLNPHGRNVFDLLVILDDFLNLFGYLVGALQGGRVGQLDVDH